MSPSPTRNAEEGGGGSNPRLFELLFLFYFVEKNILPLSLVIIGTTMTAHFLMTMDKLTTKLF
jgi:hypothetical protein